MQRGSPAKNDDVDVVGPPAPTDSGATLKRDKARMGWVPERVVSPSSTAAALRTQDR